MSRVMCYLLFPALCAVMFVALTPHRLMHLIEMVSLVGVIGEAIFQMARFGESK
jgi:hypothetical protein